MSDEKETVRRNEARADQLSVLVVFFLNGFDLQIGRIASK